jgi:hypothetical protein
MAKRKKSTAATYELLSIPLSGYKASVDASVNHHARDAYSGPFRSLILF